MTFLESWGKTGQDRHVYNEKFGFQNSFFFYLNSTCLWVICENECHHQILPPKWPVKHVPQDTHAIFSYGDLNWPDLDLCLALAPYKIFIIVSIALWQSLGLQLSLSGLVSAADKAKRVSVKLWSGLDPTFHHFKNKNLFRIPSLRAFGRRIALLAQLISPQGTSMPPPTNGRWMETQTPRGLTRRF